MSDRTHTDRNDPVRAVMVGCGKMGGAMLSRWVQGDTAEFTVVDPGGPPAVELRHVGAASELGDERFDVLIAAVKPQVLDAVLPDYRDRLTEGAFALSIAAGVASKRVASPLGGVPVVRVMPNLPAAVGKGVSALYADENVLKPHADLATSLVEATGTAVWVDDEDQIDRFTSVAGSGPGYVFELMRAYEAAAREIGFDEAAARELVLGTVAGAAEMARQDSRPFEALRDDVTSPNGTTQAGLDALRRDGLLEELFQATVRAAYDRAVELR